MRALTDPHARVIAVAGVPDVAMAGMNVLLLGQCNPAGGGRYFKQNKALALTWIAQLAIKLIVIVVRFSESYHHERCAQRPRRQPCQIPFAPSGSLFCS